MNNPFPARRDFALGVLEQARHDIGTTTKVEVLARTYEQNGIKPLDAVHLASAVVSEADLFCSTDDRLLRKARIENTRTTRVVSPLELIVALEP